MTEKPNFLKLVPQGLPAAPPEVSACGLPECEDGWMDTPLGAVRCPKCASSGGTDGSRYELTWDDMRLRHESWKLARALGENIDDVVRECINVVMFGLKGRGKTQAGVLLSKDAALAGYSSRVVDWAAWVDSVVSDYSRREYTQAQHIEGLVRPRLLVLDDVGAAQSKEGDIERKLFTRLIGARYNAQRPTVITANLTRRELEVAMGERAFDRIQHACEWVLFDGPSERAEVEGGRVQGTLERIRKAAGL